MTYIKTFCVLILVLLSFNVFSQKAELFPYVDYLKQIEKISAKDYILNQFEKHDIVILCERDHSEFTQYNLVKEILSDNRFKKNVKNLFTEIGLINLQPEITEYLKFKESDSLSVNKELNRFQQNASFWFIWERYNFHFLLRTIYDINNKSANQISYYPSDVEFDWKNISNVDIYTKEQDFEIEPRDSLIAQNIIQTYERIKSKKNEKALIILNYRHAFKINSVNKAGDTIKNVGKFLTDYFGNRLVSILTNRPIFVLKGEKYSYELIQDGKWDAAFKLQNIEDIGFDIANSIFGNDTFDLWNGMVEDLKYHDVFDGFVFYEPLENQTLMDFYPGLVPKDFEKEFFRRYAIQLEYFEDSLGLKKIENDEFRKNLLKEVNTTKVRKYPNFDHLLQSREKYLIKN